MNYYGTIKKLFNGCFFSIKNNLNHFINVIDFLSKSYFEIYFENILIVHGKILKLFPNYPNYIYPKIIIKDYVIVIKQGFIFYFFIVLSVFYIGKNEVLR